MESLKQIISNWVEKKRHKAELMERVPRFINKAITLSGSNPDLGTRFLKVAYTLYSELNDEFNILHNNFNYWRKTDRMMQNAIRGYFS